MAESEKEYLRRILPISKLLIYYGAEGTTSQSLFHCFRHEDKNPSLIASDERQVATCESPKCDIKRGSDIFGIIKLVEGARFPQALHRANEIAQGVVRPSKGQKTSPVDSCTPRKDTSTIPTPEPLMRIHNDWLRERYGKDWKWLVEHFHIKAFYDHHITFSVSEKSSVFIPVKDDAKHGGHNHIFYRGEDRGCQVFPNKPDEHRQAEGIIVVEGEKDVLRVTLALHQEGLLGKWTAISNTIGAGNLKVDTPIFSHFDTRKVREVILCYDKDDAGREASGVAGVNARNYFGRGASIKTIPFKQKHPKGYDISDWLDEGHQIKNLLDNKIRCI